MVPRENRGKARARLGAMVAQREIAQPQFLAVGESDFGVGPVRLIPANTVAGITHFEQEGVGPIQGDVDLSGGRAIPHDLGLESHLVPDGDLEDDTAFAPSSILIVIQTDHRGEPPGWTRQAHLNPAHRVAVKSVRVFLGAYPQRAGAATIENDRVVVGKHIQAGFGTLGRGWEPVGFRWL